MDLKTGDGEAVAKKQKRGVKFQEAWLSNYKWIRKGNDDFSAKCCMCSTYFSISHGGEFDVKKHQKTVKHRNLSENASTSRKVTSFFTSTSNQSEKDSVVVAEATFAYHSIMHCHSFLSSDCAGNLFSSIFPDSTIALKYSCGKTKMSKIVQNVLAPHSREVILKDLENCLLFSVSTDASNKGNVKTFPLLVRYFKKTEGVKTKLLRFFSCESEKSVDVAADLKNILTSYNLDLGNMTAFSADNASVNFGKQQSIFTELKKYNNDLIAMGCLDHVIHNSCKAGLKMLRYDVENIVIKIYNEFSSSTKKTTELKEFFKWMEVEWSECLRHCPTRWLSLVPAVDRLLKNFEPIKSYFMSQNGTSKYQFLVQFFEDETAEAYLGLISHVGELLNKNVRRLESESCQILDLHSIMVSMRDSLKLKISEHFYGSIATQTLTKCQNADQKNIFLRGADCFLESVVQYLEKWYDFEGTVFKNLKIMRLEECPKFSDLEELINVLKMKNINLDQLFDEFVDLKTYISQTNAAFLSLAYDVRWVEFFKHYPSASNLEKMCNFIFSMPHSNASAERIFSLMFTAWRKDRNRLALESVEAELMIKTNYQLTCSDFKKYISENKSLQASIKSSKKYE